MCETPNCSFCRQKTDHVLRNCLPVKEKICRRCFSVYRHKGMLIYVSAASPQNTSSWSFHAFPDSSKHRIVRFRRRNGDIAYDRPVLEKIESFHNLEVPSPEVIRGATNHKRSPHLSPRNPLIGTGSASETAPLFPPSPVLPISPCPKQFEDMGDEYIASSKGIFEYVKKLEDDNEKLKQKVEHLKTLLKSQAELAKKSLKIYTDHMDQDKSSE